MTSRQYVDQEQPKLEYINSDKTLKASDSGTLYIVNTEGNAPITITMPLLASVPMGWNATFMRDGDEDHELVTLAGNADPEEDLGSMGFPTIGLGCGAQVTVIKTPHPTTPWQLVDAGSPRSIMHNNSGLNNVDAITMLAGNNGSATKNRQPSLLFPDTGYSFIVPQIVNFLKDHNTGAYGLRADTPGDLFIYSSDVAPTVNDDITQHHWIGQIWRAGTSPSNWVFYLCAAATTGAAIWRPFIFPSAPARPVEFNITGAILKAMPGADTSAQTNYFTLDTLAAGTLIRLAYIDTITPHGDNTLDAGNGVAVLGAADFGVPLTVAVSPGDNGGRAANFAKFISTNQPMMAGVYPAGLTDAVILGVDVGAGKTLADLDDAYHIHVGLEVVVPTAGTLP
jgi:hypothetical protein